MDLKAKLNILIIDDDRTMRKVIRTMINVNAHSALTASNHVEALSLLSFQKIDLILMDIEMPDVNGFELTKMIRKQLNNWIPIIFLSANKSDDYLAKGIDAGGDDYLTKPVNKVILEAKIRSMTRIYHMQEQLDELNKKLEMLSSLDPLTQILNRRGLTDRLQTEWKSSKRNHDELSVLMLDIDNFKLYNDNYGHSQGDSCLQNFSKVLTNCMQRPHDSVARYGGEEFLILLPCTPIEQAHFKAEQIIKALSIKSIPHEYSPVANFVTTSIGVSSSEFGAKDYEELIDQADSALFLAKDQGRNQSVIFEPNQ
jgi:diguanylate cyclase (GGDEF)-like protein